MDRRLQRRPQSDRRSFLGGTAAILFGPGTIVGSLDEPRTRIDSTPPTDDPSPGKVVLDGPPSFEPHPEVTNPVLTAADVADRSGVKYVADPFVAVADGTYHLFFEVQYEREDRHADLAHATSPDGLRWEYDQVVIADEHHLAYPAVARRDGEWYLTPDTSTYRFGGVPEFRLYRADPFPGEWTVVERTMEGEHVGDPTLVRWNDVWYLFSVEEEDVYGTRLHYADSPVGDEWTEHPASPVVTDTRNFRPAGRPIVGDESLYFFYQDVERTYGDKVRCYEVTTLTTEEYAHEETETSPILEASRDGGWNDDGMHHVDPALLSVGNENVVAVDGKDPDGRWSIGIYRRVP